MTNILIVEDDKMLQFVYSKMLKKNGYQVSLANDGKVGLKKIEKDKPDLVLLDINLPFKSGLEVLSELRTKNNQTPVILMTASIDPQLKSQAENLGCSAYFVKPITIKNLIETIPDLLV